MTLEAFKAAAGAIVDVRIDLGNGYVGEGWRTRGQQRGWEWVLVHGNNVVRQGWCAGVARHVLDIALHEAMREMGAL